MKAQLKWKWISSLTGVYGVVITGTSDSRIDGMYMGRSMAEAMFNLNEFNTRRANLGLSKFAI